MTDRGGSMKGRKWISAAAIALCTAVTALQLGWMLTSGNGFAAPQSVRTGHLDISQYLQDGLADALGGVLSAKKVYRLSDQDPVAPKPNPACYGSAEDPAQLQWLLDAGAELLAGQETLFSTDTPIQEGSAVRYYLDETIFAVTWKQPLGGSMYTFSEVKIVHPSQLRRFLSDGKYGSGTLYTTTEMAQSVNAVVASSGDYYDYREIGIVVTDGQVHRSRGELLDTCFVDESGDLVFTYAGQITGQEEVQAFVDKHRVRFSLCFGPVMILNGDLCSPKQYNSGEVHLEYARSALCQMGKLHYLVVIANTEEPCYSMPTLSQFARQLWDLGIPTAYALDGGQTAAIAMDGKLVNNVSYGSQRRISDIVYFATAVPERS